MWRQTIAYKLIMKKHIDILDVTIRDGGYLIDFAFTPLEVENLVRLLDEAGVKYIEASHGLGLGAERLGFPSCITDVEYAKAAMRGRKNARIGAIGHHACTLLDDIDSVAEYIDFFRIITGAHESEKAEKYIKHCKRLGLESCVQMSRTPSVSPSAAADAAKKLADWGADIIYVVDTTGCLISGEVKQYIKKIRKAVKAKIGFHAHNMLQMAMSNTLEAIDAGCDIVDASLMGVGRDLGNASLEALTLILAKRGCESGISFRKLAKAYECAHPIFKSSKRPSWHVIYLASLKKDIYPLSLIEIISNECGKDPFDVIDTFARMEGTIECRMDDLRRLIRLLGGDPEKIFSKYGIKSIA